MPTICYRTVTVCVAHGTDAPFRRRSMSNYLETLPDIGGYPTRVLRADNGAAADAPLLPMFHGWGDSADTWKPLMQRLWNSGAELIAFDLPGFGRAAPTAPGPQLPQLIAFIGAALRSYAAGRRVLPIGQSLGARAMLTALSEGAAPHALAALAVGPAPLELPGWQKVLVRNGSLAPAVSKIAGDQSGEQRIREVVNSFRRSCFAEPERVPDSVFEDYASHYTPERAAGHIAALRDIGAELSQPLQLQRVPCPVDIVWGDRDRMAPFSGAEHYLRELPRAQLHRYEGGGHHVHLERPDEIAALIRARLGS